VSVVRVPAEQARRVTPPPSVIPRPPATALPPAPDELAARPRPPGPPREFVSGEAVALPRPPRSPSGPHPSVLVADELLREASIQIARPANLHGSSDRLTVPRSSRWPAIATGVGLAFVLIWGLARFGHGRDAPPAPALTPPPRPVSAERRGPPPPPRVEELPAVRLPTPPVPAAPTRAGSPGASAPPASPAPSGPRAPIAELAPPEPPVSDFASLYRGAARLYRRGRTEEAAHMAEQALTADPRADAAMVLLGNCRLDQGSLRKALEWADKAIAANDQNADAYLLRGAVLQQREQTTEAKRAYQRYLELAPHGEYAGDVRAILKSL
jgi:hypothetical protein